MQNLKRALKPVQGLANLQRTSTFEGGLSAVRCDATTLYATPAYPSAALAATTAAASWRSGAMPKSKNIPDLEPQRTDYSVHTLDLSLNSTELNNSNSKAPNRTNSPTADLGSSAGMYRETNVCTYSRKQLR